MFNKKKKQIAELMRRVKVEQDHVQVGKEEIARLRKQLEYLNNARTADQKALETAEAQYAALLGKNADLMDQVTELQIANGDLRCTIETQQNEAHALYEKMSAVPVRPACPADCVKHANPGPGASACRNCIRNPCAVDKYEGGTR